MTTTLIKNVQLFQNDHFSTPTNLLIEGGKIKSLNAPSATYDHIIDGNNGYLIPGLIDAHTHTSNSGLAGALKFGVTTEIEMMGMARQRKSTAVQPIADVFSAGMGVTAKGGHPAELKKGASIPASVLKEMAKMSPAERQAMMANHQTKANQKGIQTADDARQFVDLQIANGADFIKIMLDDGKFEGSQPLPVLPREVLAAAVAQAHKRGKLVVAHALAANYALEAVELGVDGLAHMFLNRDSQTTAVLNAIAEHHVFVIPCLCLNASITGAIPVSLANDPRVTSRLNDEWNQNLHRAFNTAPQLPFADSVANVRDLLDRGVNILAGTDVSQPAPNLGGLAHGASLHHELRLLCETGMTAAQALLAATAVPASIFAPDRGQIAVNKRADLVLLANNPLTNIDATLDIKHVWTAGQLLKS